MREHFNSDALKRTVSKFAGQKESHKKIIHTVDVSTVEVGHLKAARLFFFDKTAHPLNRVLIDVYWPLKA